jgi:hypothetical protein
MHTMCYKMVLNGTWNYISSFCSKWSHAEPYTYCCRFYTALTLKYRPYHETTLHCTFIKWIFFQIYIYYMSYQYGNKSKSQLTSPTPAQLPAVAVSTGHIVSSMYIFFSISEEASCFYGVWVKHAHDAHCAHCTLCSKSQRFYGKAPIVPNDKSHNSEYWKNKTENPSSPYPRALY